MLGYVEGKTYKAFVSNTRWFDEPNNMTGRIYSPLDGVTEAIFHLSAVQQEQILLTCSKILQIIEDKNLLVNGELLPVFRTVSNTGIVCLSAL